MGRSAGTHRFRPRLSAPRRCGTGRRLESQPDRYRCVCVPLTSNLKWAAAPGNVILSPRVTGLARESVANVSQMVTVDKAQLTERVGKLPTAKLELILDGIDVVLGR